jgi:hypothetical protein
MAQFTIYKSSDTNAPFLYGTTGSLITLLDACLVNGYGSQSAVGWSKPIANATSGTFAGSSYGCYQQPTGSGITLFINDNGPNVSAAFKEAWAVGWESLGSLSSSVTNSCGSGSGQFPIPAQLLTTGHVVIRKSNTSDSSSLRQWVVLDDSSSFYLLIATGDTVNMYYGFGFGDIYSFKNTTTDSYRCIIMGRSAENSSAAASDGFDICSSGTTLSTVVAGNFMARGYAGAGTSSAIAKHGDAVKGSTTLYLGNIPFPNSVDTALYISPVWVVEPSAPTVRGQLRGLYQPLHPIANFTDGQTFSGSLDYSGKTFQVFKTTPNSGMYVFETSNTLSTN